jgi:hypothetical protein
MLLFLILSSAWARPGTKKEGLLSQSLGPDKVNQFVSLFEQLLGLEEFLKNTCQSGIKREHLPAVRYYVASFIDSADQTCNYQQGSGFNRIKVHIITHMVGDLIEMFGSPDNISGMAGESQFKENFKLPGSTTQMRDSTFDEQMYNRRHQHMVINRMWQHVERISSTKQSKKQRESLQPSGNVNDDIRFPNYAENVFSGATSLPHPVGSTVKGGIGVADTRGADGISSQLYSIQMAYNKLQPSPGTTHPFEPCILYSGKEGTKRHGYLMEQTRKIHGTVDDIEMVNHNNELAGIKGCGNLVGIDSIVGKDPNVLFGTTFTTLLSPFLEMIKRNPETHINIYTELRKEGQLYHGDPCSSHCLNDRSGMKFAGAWNDWALFLYRIGANDLYYPGHLVLLC